MKINGVWSLGFVLNLFFLYSIFPIYFQSPIVPVSTVHSSNFFPRKFHRVLFFVCDGLRADTFFRNPANHPYLTSLVHKSNAAWGISDTRVPTESRPGHIALFAGIYEDPSAIFTGWKKNFVEFDSVFNRSKYSIAIGSPDIVDMFEQGENTGGQGKVDVESYSSSWQDYSRDNSSLLDTWVLDRFKVRASKGSLPMDEELLVFLHLLGVDNTGHAKKPSNPEYLEAVKVVDNIVSEAETIIRLYYGNDDKTLFIFTSDHGMTDWGSHGAGSPVETETPFVIWGNGIRHNSNQLRLKQAGFAALMSGALGIAFPTNSIGRFPALIWTDPEFAYQALVANYKQLRELMLGKKMGADLGKIPLVPFSSEVSIESIFNASEQLGLSGDYEAAISKLESAMDLTLEGIVYYERYDQRLMTALTVYSFVVWIVIISLKLYFPKSQNLKLVSTYNIFDIALSIVLTCVVMEWSLLHLPYTFVPLYLTRLVVSVARADSRFVRNGARSQVRIALTDLAVGLILAVAGIEILVMTFYHRSIISLGLVLSALLCLQGKQLEVSQKWIWIGNALLLATFPTLPIIGLAKNPYIVSLGSTLCFVMSLVWIHQYSTRVTVHLRPDVRQRVLLYIQLALNGLSGILIHFPTFILTRIFAWSSIPSMFLLPVLVSSPILTVQFLSVFLAILNPFIYLSLNYEVFFMPSLFMTLLILVKLELNGGTSWKEFLFQRIQVLEPAVGTPPDKSLLKSFKLAYSNLCFVYISFFGLGNIASISSFDPSAASCFVSVFSPFTMLGLLLVKIIGPFLLVACSFRLLLRSWKEVETNFSIVLGLCQGMSLHMFLNVTNVGSWLEIGTSISHFVIVQVTTLFLFLLFFIANLLIRK